LPHFPTLSAAAKKRPYSHAMSKRTSSYWEIGQRPQAVQEPIPKAVDFLIVGAGFMGRWLAYFLRKRDATCQIAVVEADGLGYGASTRNAGFLTTGHISEYLSDMRDVGFDQVAATFLARREGVRIVREEVPFVPLDAVGSADFDALDEEKRDLAQALNCAAGEEAFVVRNLHFRGSSRDVLFNPHDAGLHPVAALAALDRQTPNVSRSFCNRVISLGDGRALLTQGEVQYQRAFICTNAFAAHLHPQTQVQPGRGQVIVTSILEEAAVPSLGYLHAGYDYFRMVDGRFLLGGGRNRFAANEACDELQTTQEVRTHLIELARSIIGHERWQVDYHWAGIMGFVGGQHLSCPEQSWLDAKTQIVAGFGGMGVALTPRTAKHIVAHL
jgi:glycine/D-amino acid oxidase-like deaminating enzyme